MKKIIGVLLLCTVTNAMATNFVLMAEGVNQLVTVDLDSIKKDGNKRTYWEVDNFTKPRKLEGKPFNRYRARVTLDCQTDTFYSTTSRFMMNEEDVFVDLKRSTTLDIEPASVMQELEQKLCKM